MLFWLYIMVAGGYFQAVEKAGTGGWRGLWEAVCWPWTLGEKLYSLCNRN